MWSRCSFMNAFTRNQYLKHVVARFAASSDKNPVALSNHIPNKTWTNTAPKRFSSDSREVCDVLKIDTFFKFNYLSTWLK